MQTKPVRLCGALLAMVVVGAIALPGPSATAEAVDSLTIDALPAECDLLGATDVSVRLGGLVVGEKYTVSVAVASTRSPVEAKPLEADAATATLVFENLLNGDSYAISIVEDATGLTALTTVSLPVCDLPTLPEPAEEQASSAPVVARESSGGPGVAPVIGGLALLQAGVALAAAVVLLVRARTARR